jgi:hypothetical protein
VQDILEALGFRSLSGNRIFPVSNNLKIKKELGRVFKPGANFENLTTQPHSFTLAAQEPITFRYRTQTGDEGADITDITPAIYDLNGTITPVAATATLATIQRVYIFQDGVIRIQPGQRVFTTLNAAITALNSDVFITDLDIAENGLYLGAIVLTRNAVDLSNISQAIFAPSIGTTANGSVASPALAYTAEDVANKQNSLAVDGTGAKYPTVDAVNTRLSTLLPNPALGNILRGNGTAYDSISELEFLRNKEAFAKSFLGMRSGFSFVTNWGNSGESQSYNGDVYTLIDGFKTMPFNSSTNARIDLTFRPGSSGSQTIFFALIKDANNYVEIQINRITATVSSVLNGVRTTIGSQSFTTGNLRNDVRSLEIKFQFDSGTNSWFFVVFGSGISFFTSTATANVALISEMTRIGVKAINTGNVDFVISN